MSDIKINTQLLKEYANRLYRVNDRLHKLDRRLDKLYFKVGLLGLYNLISADLIVGYSGRLNLAQKYLNETAWDFERAEKELQSYDPLNFTKPGSNKTKIKQKSVIKHSWIPFLPKYDKFNSLFYSQYTIPGLNDGFVPQGITYDADDGYIIISGYDENGKASRLMIIDAKTGELVKSVKLKKEDGKDYTGHAGGIVYVDGKIYITSGKKMYEVSRDDLLSSKDEDYISFKNSRSIKTQGSYVTASGGMLYTGNFIKNSEKSGVKLDNGKEIENPLCECYSLEDGKVGKKPKYYIATPKQVQGMVVKENGDIVFTTSYGKDKESKIYTYGNVLNSKPKGYKDGVPVYGVSDDLLKDTTTAPPMVEGVCSDGEKTYTIFESGANEYRNASNSKDPVDTIYVSDNY